MEFNKIKDEILNGEFAKEIKGIWDKYTFRAIVLILLLILIIATPLWDFIDGIVTTGTLVAVIINIYINSNNREKEIQEIPIYFNDKKLQINLARKDISRSEIGGLLRLILTDSKDKYNIDYMSTVNYLKDIHKIQKADLDKLIIKVSESELKDFRDDIYETNI